MILILLVAFLIFGIIILEQRRHYKYLLFMKEEAIKDRLISLESRLRLEEFDTLKYNYELKAALTEFITENKALALISKNKLIRAIAENIHE